LFGRVMIIDRIRSVDVIIYVDRDKTRLHAK
jgi:hypothetical protein